MTSWENLTEFLMDANVALVGAAVCYWSKPVARAMNNLVIGVYIRFPSLRALPGSQNAGTEWNYKVTYIFCRVMGAALVASGILDVFLAYLSSIRK